MLRIAICDDDPEYLIILESVVRRFFDESQALIKTFSSGDSLLASDDEQAWFDVAIMDVKLPGKNGIETSERLYELNPCIQIIFVSSYPQYMAVSYEVPHVWYIGKRELEELLPRALERAVERIEKDRSYRIEVINNGNVCIIHCCDALYLEQHARKTVIKTKTGVFEEYHNIDYYETTIHWEGFVRCHKSYLVNMNEVSSMTRTTLVMSNGEIIPVSRSCSENVRNYFLNLNSREH